MLKSKRRNTSTLLEPNSFITLRMLFKFPKSLGFNAMFLLFVAIVIANLHTCVHGEPQIPSVFFFGDSLLDNGNNNILITQSKSNYFPYGTDFPDGATGRFSNGQNAADVIANLAGFPNRIPPFATARGADILNGVNYASGAAGIRKESGKHMGDNLSLDKQVFNHRLTISRLVALKRNSAAVKTNLTKSLYVFNIGSNDFLNNYFLPQYYLTSRLFTPQRFVTKLIDELSSQIEDLVELNAKKFAIFNLGNLGCIPAAVARNPVDASGCVDAINNAVVLFNDKLKLLVDDLNGRFTSAKFIYLNTTNTALAIDPVALGITVAAQPCCNVSTTLAFGQCLPGIAPCPNRNNYVFYDLFHPTENISNATTSIAYNSQSPLDAYPFDINQLVQLQL